MHARPHTRSGSARARLTALIAGLPLLPLAFSGCLVGELFFEPTPRGAEVLRSGHIAFGAWLGDWPTDSRPLARSFERTTDTKLDMVDVFLDWFTPFRNVSHTVDHLHHQDIVPVLTWEPQGLTAPDIVSGSKTVHLRDGRQLTVSRYLDEFAKGACAAARDNGQPILLRPMHEMNGNWDTWDIGWEAPGGEFPNTDESFRQAWIRMHGAFSAHCTPGRDVLFLFAINHYSVGPGTSYMGPYPGDAYVDFVGIDGYNWGDNAGWGWQTFDELFRDGYCAIAAATDRPIIVSEWGASESGGDKARWIRDSFGLIVEQYTQVRGAVWLNEAKIEDEVQGPMDWPVDSSKASLNAYRETVRHIQGFRDNESYVPPPIPADGNGPCR